MEYYNIYHPVEGVINQDCKLMEFAYEFVATVEAKSLNDAFTKAQNFNEDYAIHDRRSTCVGDIITKPDNTVHMVMGTSFKKISADALLYGVADYEFIAQQVLDNPEDYGLI